jgi:hypothetical protein
MRPILALLVWAILAFGAVAASSSFTLPSTTTGYSAGQLMANSATAGSVVVPSFSLQGMTFDAIIPRGEIFINDSTSTAWGGQTITVDLWSAAPTFANGDRGAFSPATGTASHLAAFTCKMSAEYGDGVWGECGIVTGNALIFPAATPVTVYWTATATTGSGTTGASKVVSFTPEVVH